jgi:hypothetical protein
LGRAFTRAIPAACHTDPLWAEAALGDTGKLELAIHVDEGGHITSAEPQGRSRPKALLSLVRRTVVLLQAGTFAVRAGAVGEGTEILELRAMVSDVPDPADKLASDTERGKAEFTQATGRHVEVTVKVLRIEAR